MHSLDKIEIRQSSRCFSMKYGAWNEVLVRQYFLGNLTKVHDGLAFGLSLNDVAFVYDIGNQQACHNSQTAFMCNNNNNNNIYIPYKYKNWSSLLLSAYCCTKRCFGVFKQKKGSWKNEWCYKKKVKVGRLISFKLHSTCK